MKHHEMPLSPELPEELRAYLETVPPVTPEDLARLDAAAKALNNDAAFQAEYLKSLFVAKLLAALAERKENQNQLAQRWGKTRQYVSKLFNEDKRVNFTIETMTELAHLMGRRLELQVLSPGEASYVRRCQSTERRFVASEAEWEKTGPSLLRIPNVIAQFGICVSTEKTLKPIAYDTDLAA